MECGSEVKVTLLYKVSQMVHSQSYQCW